MGELFKPFGPPASGAFVLTVITLPSGSRVHVSSLQLPNFEFDCVPNAVPAAFQLLFTGSQTAVWLLEIAPKITRPSVSMHAEASP